MDQLVVNKRFLSNFVGGGFFSVPKRAIKVFGVERTVWLTALFEWRNLLLESGNLSEDDFFYLKQDSIQEATTISTDKPERSISAVGTIHIFAYPAFGQNTDDLRLAVIALR